MKADKEGYSVTTVRRSRMAAYKGRTIRKVMGGVGKKNSKNHASENTKQKIRAKKKVKGKEIRAEGRSSPRPCYMMNNK